MVVETKVRPLVVLDPTVEPVPGVSGMASRSKSLDGVTVGLLSNGKPYAQPLLDAVVGELEKEYKIAGVVRRNKGNVSIMAPSELVEDLCKEVDFVITAIGD